MMTTTTSATDRFDALVVLEFVDQHPYPIAGKDLDEARYFIQVAIEDFSSSLHRISLYLWSASDECYETYYVIDPSADAQASPLPAA